jgi:HD-GYP domain-containing protein (c-di-GMP phosphodiesterase class II)
MSARRELLAANDAQIGMYVAELDRPWAGTPFLMQGFVIEDEATILQLKSLCRFIYIDRSRSLGEHNALDADEDVASPVGRSARPTAAIQVDRAREGQAGFLELLALVRKGRLDADTARRLAGPLPGDDETCTIEREIVRAAVSFDQTVSAFDHVVADLRDSRKPDLRAVVGSVEEMMRSIRRNPDALLWLLRLKRYDDASYQHALEVTVHLMLFARSLGFAEEGVTLLGVVGLMQDIGKIRLPERVLKKAGPLTRLEKEIAKTHVEFSLQIIAQSANGVPGVIDVVGRHHERIDGSGYPRGLRGAEIGLHGEMAGIVDTFCAMTNPRPYETAQSSQRVLEALVRQRDVKFSAAVVDGFIQCIGLYPAGTLVELNSGEVAVVISQNRVRRMQPRVLVLHAADRTPNRYPPTLDLLYAPLTPSGKPYAIVRSLPVGSYGIDPAEFYLS